MLPFILSLCSYRAGSSEETDPARKIGKLGQLPHLSAPGAALRERWDSRGSRGTGGGVTSPPAAAWPLMGLIQTARSMVVSCSASPDPERQCDEPDRTGLSGSMGCSSSAGSHTVGISYSVQLLQLPCTSWLFCSEDHQSSQAVSGDVKSRQLEVKLQ